MNYYKEIVYNGCTSGKGFNHDQFGYNGYRVIVRTNVINEELRYKGFEGNERGVSEIKMQIMLASRQWLENKRLPFSSILRCIEVLLMGLFRVIGWGVRAIGVVRICNGFPFRNPDP